MNIEATDRALTITASAEEAAELLSQLQHDRYSAEGTILDALREHGVEWVSPSLVGALTDGPIFTDDADYPDDGGAIPHEGANVYWFDRYQIEDPWEVLATTGKVSIPSVPSGPRRCSVCGRTDPPSLHDSLSLATDALPHVFAS